MSKFIPRVIKPQHKSLILPDGLKRNPILRFPLKKKCYCGKIKIFKHCCFKKLPRFVTDNEAEKLEAAMKEVGL